MPSPLSLLRAGPPPPKVALLPDAMFFTRAVPIAAGATAAEAAAQVELALEANSPFPVAQLYYGWYWVPGAEAAFAFAAYRRRFTTDQAAEWEGAELVLPSFAAVLGAPELEPATTIVLHSPDGLTAVHWVSPPIPAKVVCRPLHPEATEEDRAAARDELLRAFSGSKTVVDLQAPLVADSANDERELVFRAGDFVSRVPLTVAAGLDVRDKGELAALRGARKRDVMLWRVAVGCAAALLLLALGEFAVIGGRMWNEVRIAKVRGQKSTVDRIMASQSLANRIEELATKRLLPFEMITVLSDQNRKPPEILFRRVVTPPQSIYTLVVDAVSTNDAQIGAYRAALQNVPEIERVEIRDERVVRGGTATFTLVVTFKPVLKPADSIAQ